MPLNDRYTKHLVVSDSATVNPSQTPENVILVNSAGQKISTKTDAELNSRFAPPVEYIDDWWHGHRNAAISTQTLTNGIAHFVPFWFPKGFTVTGIAWDVTGGGSTGAVVRFAIHSSTKGVPDALLVDAGTSAATSIAPVQTSGLSQVIPSAGIYHVSLVQQGGPVTSITGRHIVPVGGNNHRRHPTLASAVDANSYGGLYKTGITGAHSATLGGITSDGGTWVPALVIKGTNP